MSKNNLYSRKQDTLDARQLKLPQLIMVAGSSEVRSIFKKKRMISTGNYVRKTGTGVIYAVYNGRNPKDLRECCWRVMFSELAS